MSTLYHDPIPNTSGIYRITCTTTGKFYVGSAINLRRRWWDHKSELSRAVHINAKLQHAWNKYGEQSFTFEVLELVLIPDLLTACEQKWLDNLKPFGNKGFNIARVAGSWYGLKHSPETREKMRGKPMSQETKEKLRLAQIGRKRSEETRRKQAKARTGQTHSPETLEKMSIAQTGHAVSPETRAKLRAANIGKMQDPEHHASQMRTLIAIAPDGTKHIVHGIKRFCREHHINYNSLTKVAQGVYSQTQGWKAYYPD